MYLEKFRLDGRIAFLTGAARGIGYCTAEAYAEAGATVIVSDLTEDAVGQAVASLRAKGFRAHGQVLDVTDAAACEEAARRANMNVGNVDVVLANAGIALPSTNAEDMSDADWHKVIDINVNGVFWTCRAFGKRMLERQRGSIVAIGSMSGFISNRPQNQSHYNASKAAVHHLVRSLAGEWAERGVRVNAVAPTYVATAMTKEAAKDPAYYDAWMHGTPMARMVDPEEIASVNLFLASDASSGMTGSIVLVDAGYTIW